MLLDRERTEFLIRHLADRLDRTAWDRTGVVVLDDDRSDGLLFVSVAQRALTSVPIRRRHVRLPPDADVWFDEVGDQLYVLGEFYPLHLTIWEAMQHHDRECSRART
jgi:hypothetical protein